MQAPWMFRYSMSRPETSRPMTPSAGMAWAQCQGQGSMANREGQNRSAIMVPTVRRTAEPPRRDRIHPQEMPPIHNGRRKAENPMDWRRRSLRKAPKGPIQLATVPGAAGSAAVFQEGSEG